jgi:hypothetical protein
MRYSEAQGTLIYEKNLKSKISCQTPFKEFGFSSNKQFFIKLYSSNIKLVTLYNLDFLQYTNNKLFCSNSVSSTSFAKLCGHCSYTVCVPTYCIQRKIS